MAKMQLIALLIVSMGGQHLVRTKKFIEAAKSAMGMTALDSDIANRQSLTNSKLAHAVFVDTTVNMHSLSLDEAINRFTALQNHLVGLLATLNCRTWTGL